MGHGREGTPGARSIRAKVPFRMADEPDDSEEAGISSPRAPSVTPFADDYLRSRAAFRESASREFASREPRLMSILDAAGELISAQTMFLSGRDLRVVEGGPLIGRLIVSYCRTHFIAADLIRQCELIEASVLMRKQMELIARLHELEREGQSQLEGKTPQIKWLLSRVKRLYGELSAIAHSAKDEPLGLLGHLETNSGVFAPLYPEFDDNAYAAAHNLGLLAAEFYVPCRAFCRKVAPDDAPPNAELLHRFLLMTLGDNIRAQNSTPESS